MTNQKSNGTTAEPRTRQIQIMEAIAYHIAFYQFDLEDLRSMNEEGMTVKVRFNTEVYASSTDFTEVSDIRLDDADIIHVMDMANEIEWLHY
jgi:hypothetical protein